MLYPLLFNLQLTFDPSVVTKKQNEQWKFQLQVDIICYYLVPRGAGKVCLLMHSTRYFQI